MEFFVGKLTKDYILNKVSQEEIFERYLGIYPEPDKRFKNPLRDNSTPNSEFIFVGNYIYLRDWGGNDKNINCFDVVKLIYKNCSYEDCLKHICNDFGLDIESSNSVLSKEKREINQPRLEDSISLKKLSSIKIKKKDFTKKELEFWNCNGNFNYSTRILESHQIYSTDYVWYNDKQVKSREGVFAYQLKPGMFQIYSPFSDDRRYRFRCTDLKGVIAYVGRLKKSKYVIVTKSVKDCEIAFMHGLNACAFLNEGIIPTEEEITYLSSFGELIFLYDNDEKGREVINKIAKIYPFIKFIFVPSGKDLYEFTYKEGRKVVEQWIDENNLISCN